MMMMMLNLAILIAFMASPTCSYSMMPASSIKTRHHQQLQPRQHQQQQRKDAAGILPFADRRAAALHATEGDTSESSDKLVFDTASNRFYEANVDEMQEEQFVLIDKQTQKPILLTREEKERIFLDAIQSYYFSGKTNIPDKQFDRLKEDLIWEGSALVSLNRNETLFMNAMQAYEKGSPILSDQEFDELKKSLQTANSQLAVQTEPKCYVDTGVCKVTWKRDDIRTASLYVPAAAFLTTIYIGALYEIPFVRAAFNPLVVLLIGLYPIVTIAKEITENFLFDSPEVAGGPCPSCGVENKIFFGDVLGVEGEKEQASLKCTNCKTPLTVKRSTLRVSTLPGKAPGPPSKAPKAASSAAAASSSSSS